MFGRSKPKLPCSSCGRALRPDAIICSCGHPTANMTFEQRARHEVERWRETRARQRSA